MMSFKTRFQLIQDEIRERKLYMNARRALETQQRAKIKPSAMNPVLLNSVYQGGDSSLVEQPLELYWPRGNQTSE